MNGIDQSSFKMTLADVILSSILTVLHQESSINQVCKIFSISVLLSPGILDCPTNLNSHNLPHHPSVQNGSLLLINSFSVRF